MKGSKALLRSIEEALEVLEDHVPPSSPRQDLVPLPLSSLLEQCRQMGEQIAARPPEPVRTLHHFACTGGTLVSKCLAAMPNTQVLSEVDPLSPLTHLGFAPTDLLLHIRHSNRGVPDAVLVDMFLAALKVMYDHSLTTGTHLVLRDHTHSHFCTGPEIPVRQSLREIIGRDHPVLSVVTVRHPLDSYLSLERNNWRHYSPPTFDEYCRRYLAFLDRYDDVATFKYEDLTTAPDETLMAICEELQLPFAAEFRDYLSLVHLTGDSGRSGLEISPKPRRPVPEEVEADCRSSPHYRTLCGRLEYEPDCQQVQE